MKVLILEDEEKAALFLKKGLSENGFTCDHVATADDALAATSVFDYQLLIIDINLRGKATGLDFLKQMKLKKYPARTIVLTARDEIDDRVQGIEAGANVYLVKPYSFSELLAYARSLTAQHVHDLQMNASGAQILQVSDLQIDLLSHSARRGKTTLDLTAKEYSLLLLLARRKGQVLSRAVIADQLWGMNFDPGTNVVDVHIKRLRAKVDEPFLNHLIWTVRGLGYVLEDRQKT